MRAAPFGVVGVLLQACASVGGVAVPAVDNAQPAVASARDVDRLRYGQPRISQRGADDPPHTVATPAVEPISGALPSLTLADVEGMHPIVCAHGECVPDLACGGRDSEDGNVTASPTHAWIQIIRAGATLRLPRTPSVVLLGAIVSGQATLSIADGGRPQHLPVWTAFRIGESGAWIHADHGPVAVGLFLVDVGPSRTGLPSAAPAPAPPSAPGPRVADIQPIADVQDVAWNGGAFHARILFEPPRSPAASLEVLIASPHGRIPEHNHPGSWETLLALQGSGHLHIPQQTLPGTSANDMPLAAHDRAIGPGVVSCIPIGVRHAWEPDGSGPLVALQVYTPPGPEQRFRRFAASPAP